MKLKLDKEYNYRGELFGPGDADVPDEVGKLIKRHQKASAAEGDEGEASADEPASSAGKKGASKKSAK